MPFNLFWFVLKKSFFDYWDNLYKAMFVNLVISLLMVVNLYLPDWMKPGGLYYAISEIAVLYLVIWLISAWAFVCKGISEYEYPHFGSIVSAFRTAWKEAVLISAVLYGQILAVKCVPDFLMTHASRLVGITLILNLLVLFTLFWVSMVYYLPIRSRLDMTVFKALLRSFALAADNLVFSFGLILFSLIAMSVSLLTFGLLPGLAFVLVLNQVATRTLLLKYRGGHAQSGGAVNWQVLLADDIVLLKKRTLKNVIFPFK